MGGEPSFFIAGIIQGSLPDSTHPQDYRKLIVEMIRKGFPGAEVFDPVEKYPNSLEYDSAAAGKAFFDLMELSGRHDVLIAFIPEASMGTAIELWNAHKAGALVVSVSPLAENWVVKYLSDKIVANLKELEQLLASGELTAMLAGRRPGLGR